jgi:hypothetical protein
MLPGPPDDSTLGEVMEAFELEGYRGQMAARPAGLVLCLSCHRESDASEMEVNRLRRVEGVSDPAEMLAIAALVCPVCGTPGTLVLGYGPEATRDDSDVLARLADVGS